MKATQYLTRKRLLPLAIALPIVGGVSLGAAGLAHAATAGNSDRPTYQSSIKTTATEDPKNQAAADLALTKAAKIDLTRAAAAGVGAIPGGAATSVELSNKGGNVVYEVTVVTSTTETDVIVDAGNAKVLAKQVDNEKGGSEGNDKDGSSTAGAASQSSHGSGSATTGQ